MSEQEDLDVTPSCGNIFEDLGLPNPEERLLKSQLAWQISLVMEERGLTQAQAAELAGLTQPDLSLIVGGRLKGFSVETLLRALAALGRRVRITVEATDRECGSQELVPAGAEERPGG